MIWLDTSCLVKLYYPEPDSAKVISLIMGKSVCFTPLHEMEFVNALQLKVFHGSATGIQAAAARALLAEDVDVGTLVSPVGKWSDIFAEAVKTAERNTAVIGCRSLDLLHCAAARVLLADEFISSDTRQRKLAAAMGLNIVTL